MSASASSPLPPDLRYPTSISQDIGLLFLQRAAGGARRRPRSDASTCTSSTRRSTSRSTPSGVGAYDTNSALYRHYTVSRGNTTITPSIRRTAQRVVGSETNPYLAAQRLYRYVLDTVKYSHMPHFAMWPRGVAESVYVHEHKYGDCGAQSMYFSALCRAVGIPARTHRRLPDLHGHACRPLLGRVLPARLRLDPRGPDRGDDRRLPARASVRADKARPSTTSTSAARTTCGSWCRRTPTCR